MKIKILLKHKIILTENIFFSVAFKHQLVYFDYFLIKKLNKTI